jgi:ABC-2 type transport system permease protein
MTLLTVERMKLLSTRSPWWCMAVAVALTVGLTTILSFATPSDGVDEVTPAVVQFAYTFGLVVMMVMAALAVTTEYRFSTIRTTFLAVPNRTKILVAKAAVVALFAGLIGEIAAVGSWGIAYLVLPDAPLGLNTEQEFRNTFGVGLIYFLSAVIAVAVGLLVRQTAGALAAIFVWLFLLENLLPAIPRIGDHIQDWLPFTVGNNFLVAGQPPNTDGPPVVEGLPFGPWGSLIYYAVVACGLLAVALVLARRRDA